MIPAPRTSAFGMAGRMAKSGSQARGSFLEKKNQKTFFSLASRLDGRRRQPEESLFASFSSEKEDH
ncbi:hypothetical protein [Pseudoroseomonas cervicalis]|uniref:hypothetical protein n=1 Tax=Teichococcus cervicalis TaxID=204525 RepID=UPI0027D7CB89|nr:hypothetical protein [Pseudoroseomonas cervicalis]